MFCTNCGFKLETSFKFCNNCGAAKLPITGQPSELTPEQKTIEPQEPVKISVMQVLFAAVVFYKMYFKRLAGISVFMFVFYMNFVVVYILPTLEEGRPLTGAEGLFIFAYIVFVIATFAFLPKISMAMPFFINSLMNGDDVTIGQAFRQSRGKYWRWVGIFLLLSVPTIILMILRTPHIVTIIAIASYSAFFYMLCPMISIEPKTNRYLRKSFNMIKGNYKPALIFILITVTSLSAIGYVIRQFMQNSATALATLSVISAAVYFFAYPFAETVEVIVYRQLKGTPVIKESTEEL